MPPVISRRRILSISCLPALLDKLAGTGYIKKTASYDQKLEERLFYA